MQAARLLSTTLDNAYKSARLLNTTLDDVYKSARLLSTTLDNAYKSAHLLSTTLDDAYKLARQLTTTLDPSIRMHISVLFRPERLIQLGWNPMVDPTVILSRRAACSTCYANGCGVKRCAEQAGRLLYELYKRLRSQTMR